MSKKKNPRREAEILRSRIVQKYGAKVSISLSTKEIIMTKDEKELVRIKYNDMNSLLQALKDIYENESSINMKGGQNDHQ